jgi:hypothetical protein
VLDQSTMKKVCSTPWGRVWRFTAVSASVVSKDPKTGNAWDALGGAPDPFMEFYLGEQKLAGTKAIQDTFAPTWNEYTQQVINKNSPKITFYLWDEDTSAHDYITGVGASPDGWLPYIKNNNGTLNWSDQGTTLIVNVQVL